MAVPATLSSVPNVSPYIQYVAASNQTVYPYPFPITQDSDLVVVINGVTQATDSGYSVSGVGNPTGGNCTLNSGSTAGDIITLYRDIAIERISQISQNSGFSSTVFNNEFNNFYLIAQQLEASIAQCLQIPNTNNPAPTTTLTKANYANKYLAFDGNGNPTPADLTSSGTLTQAIIAALLFPQTSAENSAGVTPSNYAYPDAEQLSAAKRFGADPSGSADSTTAIQDWANSCGGVMIFPPNGTFKVKKQIDIPDGTVIYGHGSTLVPDATAWASAGWNVLNLKGSAIIERLNVTATAESRNTSWKAVAADNAAQSLPAGSRIAVRDCVFKDTDIGLYVDGGISSFNVDYAEMSGCKVSINSSGTGGGSSVRPTFGVNNCVIAVCDRNYLDAVQTGVSVNNIYGYSNQSIHITRNTLVNGQLCKLEVNAGHPTDQIEIRGNKFIDGTDGLTFIVSDVVKHIVIDGNLFDSQNPGTDEGCILFQTAAAISGDAFEVVEGSNNYFRSQAYKCWYPGIQTGNTFGALILTGNRYYNCGTASSGTYGIVDNGSAGTYRSLTAHNEVVLGNSNTRSYLEGSYAWGDIDMVGVREVGITGTANGWVRKTATLTLTGGTTSPTVTATYSIRDGVCTLYVPSTGNVTSNADTMTLTGLPTECQPQTAGAAVMIQANDNGTLQSNCTAAIVNGSGTITLSKNGAATGWTSSGSKGPTAFSLTYPLG